jgi:hypothetical protein
MSMLTSWILGTCLVLLWWIIKDDTDDAAITWRWVCGIGLILLIAGIL